MNFNIFKKKDKDKNPKEKNPMVWGDITLAQFLKLQKLDMDKDKDDYIFKFAAIVHGYDYDEFERLPLSFVNECMQEIQPLLDKSPKAEKINSHTLILNGKTYTITDELSLSQYIDFQAIFKDYQNNMAEFLSILLLPEGKQYNDGYSKEDVIKDIEAMSIETAMGLSRFFFRKWKRSLLSSLTYSQRILTARMIKERKTLTKEQKMEMDMALTGLRLQRKQLQAMESEFGFK